MVNFVVFLSSNFTFLRLLQMLLCCFYIVACVGDGVDNGPDAVTIVVGFDFLSKIEVSGIWLDKDFVRVFWVLSNDSIIVCFGFISFYKNVIFFLRISIWLFSCSLLLFSTFGLTVLGSAVSWCWVSVMVLLTIVVLRLKEA